MRWMALVVCCVCCTLSVHAQQTADLFPDSTEYIVEFDARQLLEDSIRSQYSDTSLREFYRFHPFLRNLRNTLGNYGQAGEDLFVSPLESPFRIYRPSVFEPTIQPEHLRPFYQTRVPVTTIHYINGPQEEQRIGFMHTQNIVKPLNVRVSFQRFSSRGFYLNQKTIYSTVDVGMNYLHRNGRYGFYVRGMINTGSVEENGGLEFDSVFYDNVEDSRLSIPVNLTGARNQMDYREVEMMHFVRFSRKRIDDTTRVGKYRFLLYGKGKIGQYFDRYLDETPDSLYYLTYFSAPSGTVEDRVQNRFLEGELGGQWRVSEKLRLRIAAVSEYHQVDYLQADTVLYNSGLKLQVPRAYWGNLSASATYQYVVAGFNSGGHQGVGRLAYRLPVSVLGWNTAFARGSYARSRPAFDYFFYENSHTSWNERWDFMQEVRLDYGITNSDETSALSGFWHRINGHTYFDFFGRPQQYTSAFSVSGLRLQHTFHYKKFYWEWNALYQQVGSEEAPLNLPEFAAYTSLVFQQPFFKRALNTQLGIDAYYNTAYFANDYLPYVRQFALQYTRETGGFLFMDVHLSLRIKRVRGFIKMTNITQGLTPSNYVMVPGYPLQDRGLRFGILWELLN